VEIGNQIAPIWKTKFSTWFIEENVKWSNNFRIPLRLSEWNTFQTQFQKSILYKCVTWIETLIITHLTQTSDHHVNGHCASTPCSETSHVVRRFDFLIWIWPCRLWRETHAANHDGLVFMRRSATDDRRSARTCCWQTGNKRRTVISQ